MTPRLALRASMRLRRSLALRTSLALQTSLGLRRLLALRASLETRGRQCPGAVIASRVLCGAAISCGVQPTLRQILNRTAIPQNFAGDCFVDALLAMTAQFSDARAPMTPAGPMTAPEPPHALRPPPSAIRIPQSAIRIPHSKAPQLIYSLKALIFIL